MYSNLKCKFLLRNSSKKEEASVLFYSSVIMQRAIGNERTLDENLNPLNDVSLVPSIDNTSSITNAISKVDKLGNLQEKGQADLDLICYIPGLTEFSRQGQLKLLKLKKKIPYDKKKFRGGKKINWIEYKKRQVK